MGTIRALQRRELEKRDELDVLGSGGDMKNVIKSS